MYNSKETTTKQDMVRDNFTDLVKQHYSQLLSFLYRFTTSKEDAEDIAQETFAKALKKLNTFKGQSSFKTWLFAIASNLAKDHLKAQKRWTVDAQDRCKELVGNTPKLATELKNINKTSAHGQYEIREHIDFCFTCIMKTLPLEQHLALMLKDIYDFKVKEVADILGSTYGAAKHYLHDARSTMRDIFDHRCALINKKGVCHQCSELNGLSNTKAKTQRKIAALELAKAAKDEESKKLFTIRTELIKAINPLHAKGTDLHDFLLKSTSQTQEPDGD